MRSRRQDSLGGPGLIGVGVGSKWYKSRCPTHIHITLQDVMNMNESQHILTKSTQATHIVQDFLIFNIHPTQIISHSEPFVSHPYRT